MFTPEGRIYGEWGNTSENLQWSDLHKICNKGQAAQKCCSELEKNQQIYLETHLLLINVQEKKIISAHDM